MSLSFIKNFIKSLAIKVYLVCDAPVKEMRHFYYIKAELKSFT